MDILRPWLAATIEGELSEALRHWEEGTNGHQSAGESRRLSYDDGSNLRIPSVKKGPVVQITKFLTYEDPIQVTISDSVIRVNASITKQASQRYTEKYRKKFTEGTLGGLIQLHEFEIVATHFGPRDKRLTLYVKELNSLGAEGSGTFGVAPQAIEGREVTKKLLGKLAELREHGLKAYSGHSAAASPIRSQPSTQTSEAGNDQDSQVGFATQVPRSIAPIGSKSKSLGSATGINTSSIPSADSTKPLTRPEKVKRSSVLASTSRPLQVQVATKKPSVNHRTALLDLLRKHKRASPTPEPNLQPPLEQLTERVTASNLPVSGEKENEASRNSNLPPTEATAHGATTGTRKRKRQPPNNASRKKASNDHDLQRIDSDRESLIVKLRLKDKASSGVAATKSSIDTLQSQPTSPSISETQKLPPSPLLEPATQSFPHITGSAFAQNTTRNRISSKDINIAKDQENLLRRADSWLPAEPGQREPSANIPISLLKRLNQKADVRAQEPIESQKQGDYKVAPSSAIDRTADSESDAPVSSGQWPASPERAQLPPDSSPASAEHSDHSTHTNSHKSRSVSHSRRQRKASFSSRSTPSGPPSPILASQILRAPEPFAMTSSRALSPSDISTLAGEEVHCPPCQNPGCDKSCKRSGGLKDHVNHHHPGTQLLENSESPAEDCTKFSSSPGGLNSHIDCDRDGNSVLPSHSGSATPTAPGASTFMSPGLKPVSEREGGSRRHSPDFETNNVRDTVKVLASMPIILDGRTKSPRDEEFSSRRSITESEWESNIPSMPSMPSEVPPALIQSPTTGPDGSCPVNENFSIPVQASPTPESELEFTVPLALNEKANLIPSAARTKSFPSTASQPQDPFTQVKRTPYINGLVQKESLQGPNVLSSTSKSNLYLLANSNSNDDAEFVSASIASGPESSTAETYENRSSHMIEDRRIEKRATRLAEAADSQEMADENEEPDESSAEHQQGTSKAVVVADKSCELSLPATESLRQSSGLSQPIMVEEVSISSPAVHKEPSTSEANHKNRPLPQLSRSDHAAQVTHAIKRKVTDLSVVSPSVTKRQKRFKVPSAFTSTERSNVPRDPSEGARQYRQDFLASRRSSESSTPTMSPTMLFTVFPAATPEKPRDPQERARQIRQEFLASRRSSESSTPTTSPRLQLTVLTGTTQAESRNAEVKTNVEQVTSQNQSVDIGVERQMMTELQGLSTRFQRQGGAPLPNGTAPLDRADANPGAQNNSPLDEVKSSMFVAQNADIEGPNAGQSMVMEACTCASNYETQRPRFVKPNVSVQSPDHGEVEDRLANAKDGADSFVSLGIDLSTADHDKSAKKVEESRPGGQESDKACKGSPSKPDEIIEQGSNVPAPIEQFDEVAEPRNAALKSIRQRSMAENLDSQSSNRIMSEPAYQERSAAIDPNAAVPDKVAMEDQQLVGVNTNTSMADVQVFQDIMPVRPSAESAGPPSQTIPLSSILSASIAESNAENQRALSLTTPSLDTTLGNPMSDSTARAAKKQQNAMHLPPEVTQHEPLSVPQGIFDKFKATYPAYTGDMKHFVAICRKISQLVQANRMEHQALWDDFIVRHRIEYPQYLRRCAEEAEDVVPYEIFYQSQIEGPQYQKLIINRRNLDEVLALPPQQAKSEHVHAKPIRGDKHLLKPIGHKPTFKSSSVGEKINHESTGAKDDESVGLGKTRSMSTHKPAISYETSLTSSASRVVIDLTEEDPTDRLPMMAKERDTALRRDIPHLANGLSVEPPPLRHPLDSSSSLYQVPSNPPLMRDSYVSPSVQPVGSPFLSAPASTKMTTKSHRRILPRTSFDHNLTQGPAKETASIFPRGLPGSGLREIRAKGSDDAGDARLRFSANSTPDGPKRSQALLNTCHRFIQSNWGIKAHELLEPEHCNGEIWSETMIELLAEIASKVSLGEARKRIKGAIDARISDNARRGAGHASQDRKILKSDLELVRGICETSSMSTTSPISPSHTNTAVEKQNEVTPSQWWNDDNSPFKSFARAYASIRPGNGNSFAKAGPVEPGEGQNVHEFTSGGVLLKRINIMEWKL